MKPISLLCLLLILGVACQNASTDSSTSDTSQLVEGVIDTLSEADPEAAAEQTETDRKNILEYYELLGAAGLLPDNYPLREQKGRWYSISPTTEEPFDIVVDIPNGFIEIADEGTGGGTFQIQVVLFRMENGKAVLGVNETANDGVTVHQNYAFYREQAGTFKNWTEHTMPPLSVFDFLPDDYAEEPDIVEEALDVYFELPRKGTKLTARVWTGKKSYMCKNHASEREQIGCAVIQRVIRESFTLDWNRKEGRFN
jgi:hypothetical protein